MKILLITIMDEIVDIVDDNDNVIGQEWKSKCHKEKILHRGSNVFVFRDDSFKEILLQKRSMKKISNPGEFCTPGGHLEPGESYPEGGKREFFEEMHNTSNVDESVKFEELFKIKKFTDNDYEFVTLFRVMSTGPFELDPEEVESCFFEDINVTLKKIETNPENYTGTTILLLKEYKKRFM